MKVMVTGGTGFVGSHAVDALQRAGHEVRLLVRSAEKLERVFKARGIEIPEATVGDMTDVGAVREALAGCDAALHAAAAMYGGADVYEANVAGVRHTLEGAHALGLDPILHVSTIAAMYPPPGDVIGPDDPITNLQTTYGRSKAEGERVARRLQDAGAPVTIVYPAGIYGPDDPGPCETSKGMRDAIRWGWPLTTTGVSVIDVRDLAAVLVAALEPGRGPRRYLAGGHFLTWYEMKDLCDRITGRKARGIPSPPLLLRAVGRILDAAKRVVSFDYPLTHEAALMMTNFVPCDSSRTISELGITFRPVEETLTDTIRSLHRDGELPAKFLPGLLGDG